MSRRPAALVLALLLAGCAPTPPEPRGVDPPPPVSPAETSVQPPDTTPPAGSGGPPVTRTPGPVALQRPDPNVTPGLVLTGNRDDMCTPGWSSAHRKDLSDRDKRDVLSAYGLPLTTVVSEWDHLISLELGGDNGRLNVWPQLDKAQDTRKDGLENRLHALVCNGSIPVAEAQDKIVHFWLWW